MQYHLPFYLEYLAQWPEYCLMAEGPDRQAMGYILGKAEGEGEKWHGHVTAVTVAPEYRQSTPHPILLSWNSIQVSATAPSPQTNARCTGSHPFDSFNFGRTL